MASCSGRAIGTTIGVRALNAEDPLSIYIRVEQRSGTDAGLAELIIGAMGIRGAGRKRRLTADHSTTTTTTLTVSEAASVWVIARVLGE